MKTLNQIFAGLVIFTIISESVSKAQETANYSSIMNLAAAPDPSTVLPLRGTNMASLRNWSDSQLAALVGALGEVPAIPASSLGRTALGGTFWSLENSSWPPLPNNTIGVGVWRMADGSYLLDDLNYNYNGLSANSMGMHAMDAGLNSPPGLGDLNTNSYAPYALNYNPPNYGTNLFLVINAATNGVLSLILSNTVYTGAGEVYEVMRKNDLAAPGWNISTQVWAVADQNWISFTLPMSSPTN